ncbi:MAG TPA: DUF4153 domain-containing protein, partial [Solirubrobacteraceae bacterium]
MPRSALICALLAGVVAAAAVVNQRLGLALSVVLLLAVAAAALSAQRRRSPWLLALAAALAVQPVLRDAGWVVAVAVVAALVAGAAAVAPLGTWPAVGRLAVAPLRLVAGGAVVDRAVQALLPEAPGRHAGAAVRGVALALPVLVCFAVLFAAADPAFAELAGDGFGVDADGWEIAWRATLGVVAVAVAGALVHAGRAPAEGPRRAPRVPRSGELAVALGALVALFALFVGVQIRVLFGGAAYVRETTGLGYGD